MEKKLYNKPKVVYISIPDIDILSTSGDGITWQDDLSSYGDMV